MTRRTATKNNDLCENQKSMIDDSGDSNDSISGVYDDKCNHMKER